MTPIARLALVLAVVCTYRDGTAQPATADATPAASRKGELDVLVPPQGAGITVPVRAEGYVLLSFPEKIADGFQSSNGYRLQMMEGRLTAVVYANANAKPADLALATQSGGIQVNIRLRVAASEAEAISVVRFQAATTEAAFAAAVATEVGRQVASCRSELTNAQQAIDRKVRSRADELLAEHLLGRIEVSSFPKGVRERTHDGVVVAIDRAAYLGPDGYLLFHVENHSGAPYRIARVQVLGPSGKNHASTVRMVSTSVQDHDDSLVGVVPASGHGRGVIVLREVDLLFGHQLAVTVEEPDSRRRVTVNRGVTLR